jgi:hypothetical protein
LRLEIQSSQAVPTSISAADFALLQQKLQFTQEHLEIVQTHSKTQIETAQGLAVAAQHEVLRLQVQCRLQQRFQSFWFIFFLNPQTELSGANHSLNSVQLQNQMLLQQMSALKDEVKSSAAAVSASAVALSASEGRIETIQKALEEQRHAHVIELRRLQDEQYVLCFLHPCCY